MEALLGILVGAILGFFLGFVKTRFGRQRTKTDFAGALHTEISLSKQGLEDAVTKARRSRKDSRVKRPTGAALTRSVYSGCIANLGLLPRDARYAVQNFCACLHDVEFIAEEARYQWEKASNQQRQALRQVFLEGGELALARAEQTLSQLEKLTE
ncbi:MAG: hypothetical protein GTO63_32970 [Anaerolineae bacterium]|nr:hypothetical protein [Anaerolineae bacterium]NIN99463.1 hypothetical protein [Anaerolineae bacterium]NIQ82328.1 hypothetical protein [Anaerolineae bacterium]